jgi:hypothetical protein
MLAKFNIERFPSDVRKAYDTGLAQKLFKNPNADPATPPGFSVPGFPKSGGLKAPNRDMWPPATGWKLAQVKP